MLVDGLGAALSAALLGSLLPHFQSHIGMPVSILRLLSLAAALLALTSFSGFAFADHPTGNWLKVVSWGNAAYSGLTLCLVLLFSPLLTRLGLAYFVVEFLIVLGLIHWERKLLD